MPIGFFAAKFVLAMGIIDAKMVFAHRVVHCDMGFERINAWDCRLWHSIRTHVAKR